MDNETLSNFFGVYTKFFIFSVCDKEGKLPFDEIMKICRHGGLVIRLTTEELIGEIKMIMADFASYAFKYLLLLQHVPEFAQIEALPPTAKKEDGTLSTNVRLGQAFYEQTTAIRSGESDINKTEKARRYISAAWKKYEQYVPQESNQEM